MSGAEESARRAREDADFQRIVEGFGDVPAFPEYVELPAPEPLVPAELRESPWLAEDHFVPEAPPPVPRPRGLRALAWSGLFGVPVLVLLAIVAHVGLMAMAPIPFLLLVWFVGSFGYLVATMSRGPSDPDSGWDDGAVI